MFYIYVKREAQYSTYHNKHIFSYLSHAAQLAIFKPRLPCDHLILRSCYIIILRRYPCLARNPSEHLKHFFSSCVPSYNWGSVQNHFSLTNIWFLCRMYALIPPKTRLWYYNMYLTIGQLPDTFKTERLVY